MKPGSRVFIAGAGPIGLTTVLAARASGVVNIAVSDIRPDRLDMAKTLGAQAPFLANDASLTDTVAEKLGGLADVSIDCSGSENAVRTAIQATRPGGAVVLVGLGPNEMRLPIVDAAVREIDLRGVFRYVNTYPTALALVASGSIDVKPLVTHRFDLSNVAEAFQTARSAAPGTVKVMVTL
jgi:L-iditol 2-dehydrogenase